VELDIDGKTVCIGGMCKGSGMIEPNMATMLGFVTTDAAVHPKALDVALRDAVEVSFNRVVVDGDRSTNDTVFLMASGVAEN
jgi:glutamate N-acetyltransferase/amino-acid N-acetyltransferase